MFINIFTPHIGGIVGMLKSKVFQCLDRKCKRDHKVTRQYMQEDYHNVYMGPEFLVEVRYSQIMTFYMIAMIYSSGMPVLYIISFFQFFVMYWFDKFLCK